MKSSTVRHFVVLISVVLVLGACKGREQAAKGDATETIAPAQPQPAPKGSDAMTQTVDIEDSRSEADGAALNDTQTPPGKSTTTTAATSTTTAKPPATTTTH